MAIDIIPFPTMEMAMVSFSKPTRFKIIGKGKMATDCKKKPINETYITKWWIEGNLPLITTMIQFWNERDENHMLNEGYEEV